MAEIRDQTWSTFVRNHARSVLACDFFATVTSTFRVFHVFVVLEGLPYHPGPRRPGSGRTPASALWVLDHGASANCREASNVEF
jgi:hypothetical protein